MKYRFYYQIEYFIDVEADSKDEALESVENLDFDFDNITDIDLLNVVEQKGSDNE